MDNLNLHTKKSHGVTCKEAESVTGVACRSQQSDQETPVVYGRQEQQQLHHHLILLDAKSASFKIVTATTLPPSRAQYCNNMSDL